MRAFAVAVKLTSSSSELRRYELCGDMQSSNHGEVSVRVFAGALTLSNTCEARFAFVAYAHDGRQAASNPFEGVPHIYGGQGTHQPPSGCPSLFVPDLDLAFTLRAANQTHECEAKTETTPICLFYGGVCDPSGAQV